MAFKLEKDILVPAGNWTPYRLWAIPSLQLCRRIIISISTDTSNYIELIIYVLQIYNNPFNLSSNTLERYSKLPEK
jgi:hypothetical protein